MVGHHQAADSVSGGQVRGLSGQRHLDAGGTPGNETGEFTFPDPLEAFMHLQSDHVCVNKVPSSCRISSPPRTLNPQPYLRWVDLPLDDVEDGDVAVAGLPLSSCGHHHVLGLQESPHHVQHCGFPHTSNLRNSRVH